MTRSTIDLAADEWAVVRLRDGTTHRGVVHTVDPESGNVVLLRPVAGGDRSAVSPIVLFAGGIASVVQQRGTAGSTESLARVDAKAASYDEATTAARLAELRDRLRQRLLPFEDVAGGGLLVVGCLRVAPPYTVASCRCENEIVLDRFLELLADLPGDK